MRRTDYRHIITSIGKSKLPPDFRIVNVRDNSGALHIENYSSWCGENEEEDKRGKTLAICLMMTASLGKVWTHKTKVSGRNEVRSDKVVQQWQIKLAGKYVCRADERVCLQKVLDFATVIQ